MQSLEKFEATEAWIPAFRRDSESGICQFFISVWILPSLYAQPILLLLPIDSDPRQAE
jgi:hypothetical protein